MKNKKLTIGLAIAICVLCLLALVIGLFIHRVSSYIDNLGLDATVSTDETGSVQATQPEQNMSSLFDISGLIDSAKALKSDLVAALRALKNEEFRAYVKIIAVSVIAVTASLMMKGGYKSLYTALRESAFQVITIMTTTGYATSDFDLWPAFCKMILVILMFIGGSSSSTAGGIKVVRVLVFLKMIKKEINIKLHGNIVNDISIGEQKIYSATLTHITAFVTLYLFTLMAGTFLISITGCGDLVTNFTAVLSCISNVGPGFGGVGPVCTYSFYDGFSTYVLSLVMVAGRLELSTFFILFSRFFWDPNRV
jgi:trk system potassium uptake protein TrkH